MLSHIAGSPLPHMPGHLGAIMGTASPPTRMCSRCALPRCQMSQRSL